MPVSSNPPSARRRYAIVGLGSRHELYQDAIERTHSRWTELVGLCDTNPGRLELARRRSALNGATVPAGYLAVDFGAMLAERRPDVVIVTTTDASHHDYIVRAMEARLRRDHGEADDDGRGVVPPNLGNAPPHRPALPRHV